jgi:hypothetical protein
VELNFLKFCEGIASYCSYLFPDSATVTFQVMEAARSSEALVSCHFTVRRLNPEDQNVKTWNFKVMFIFVIMFQLATSEKAMTEQCSQFDQP